MEYTDKDLNLFFKDLLRKDEFLSKDRYLIDDFYYILIEQKNKEKSENDFLKLNVNTKEASRIDLLTYLTVALDPKQIELDMLSKIDAVVQKVKKSKCLFREDIFDFLRIRYGTLKSVKFKSTLAENKDSVLIDFKENKQKETFLSFLDQCGLTYYLIGKQTIAIYKILKD